MAILTSPPLNFPIDEIQYRISHIKDNSADIIAKSKELQRKLTFKETITDEDEKRRLDNADSVFEQQLIELISKKFVNDHFLCENKGIVLGKNDYRWIIDAIDGSMNFLRGLPLYAISLGLCYRDSIVAGVIIIPDSQELYYAIHGNGAYKNEAQIQVSSINMIDRAFLISSFPSSRTSNMREVITEISAFVSCARSVRRSGSFILDMCWLAEGKIDGIWEKEVGVFDACASLLLVTEARGMVTNYKGEAIYTSTINPQPTSFISSNGLIHNQIIEVLNKTRNELSLN